MSPSLPCKIVAGRVWLPNGTCRSRTTGSRPCLLTSTWRYRGITTLTSWPRRRSSFDSDAATSATPPDLANGVSSDAATSTLSCFFSGAPAAAPAEHLERDRDEEGIGLVVLGRGLGARLGLVHTRHAHCCALGTGDDPNHVRGIETEVRCRRHGQRKLERAIASVRGNARAVQPELDLLRLELLR